MAKLAR